MFLHPWRRSPGAFCSEAEQASLEGGELVNSSYQRHSPTNSRVEDSEISLESFMM